MLLLQLADFRASKFDEIPDEIAERLLEGVRASHLRIPPVRLAPAVGRFGIEPEPELDPSLQGAAATIRYDAGVRRFRIAMTSNSESHLRTAAGVFTARARFAYAHEVAHRFFFAPDDEGNQIRLRELAKRQMRTDIADQASACFDELEEQLCNRAAGKMLVPEKELMAYLQDRRGDRTAAGFLREFARIVESVRTDFDVPRETALLALGDLLRRSPESLPRDLIAFYIGAHVLPGRKDGAMGAPRIEVATGTASLGDMATRMYAGRDPSVLGGHLRSLSVKLLQVWPTIETPVEVPLMVSVNGRERGVQFNGWWSLLTRPQASRSYRAGLLWGAIQTGSTPAAYTT